MTSITRAGTRDIVPEREIIESLIFAESGRSFSIYSERLLLRLVEIAQRQVLGLDFRDGSAIGQVSIGNLGEAMVEIPIRSLLGAGNTNYSQAKAAIKELMEAPYFVERPKLRGGKPVIGENGKPEMEFFASQILNNCAVNVKPGVAQIIVNPVTWQALLDFSKGFRKYDLNAAMLLSKASSVRMFRMVSNQGGPFTFSIASLRRMWKMEDKYPDTSDFIRRTIESARRELDERAPWSFTYTCNRNESSPVNVGRKGRPAITSVTFFPRRNVGKMSAGALISLTAGAGGVRGVLGEEVYRLLLEKFEFTARGLQNNLVLFEVCRKVGVDMRGFLDGVAPSALRATNVQGYVLGALVRHLREEYGVVRDESGYHVPEEYLGRG